ncbi:hypothetical protein, partial [Klebsiella pneumoniae]|uniref:hypothetical protein n=1 Tax=Klebsiella pneumoniae TaxID=573 RepID=UPI001C202A76
REPIHVAMAVGAEKLEEIFSGLAGRVRIGDADGIEAERARLALQRRLEIGRREPDRRVQKSRST